MQASSFRPPLNRLFDFICLWVLPLGLLLLLCDLFFLPGRNVHHKIYYGLFSIPTLLAVCLRPRELKGVLQEPIVVALLAFGAWAMLSLNWSPETEGFLGQVKPSLHLLMLFIGTSLLFRYRTQNLQTLLFCAATLAMFATALDLYHFGKSYAPGLRMIGGGAFDNPLLSSHVFAFFCVYWLTVSMLCKRYQTLCLSIPAAAIMFAAVAATGSRTPLVAITLAACWLSFILWNRRSLILLSSMLLTAAAVLLAFPELIGARGDSYRLEIWHIALQLIAQHPWIGYGYEAPLSIDPGIGYPLSEPHSFALGVLYYVGIIGFVPWIFMQGWALLSSWRQRAQPLMVLASTWLAFGIGAGLTEGGGILSRPKEHWYLLWVPLALIAAYNINQRARRLLPVAVTTLSSKFLEQLTTNAQVIEADHSAPKVMQLADGSFLKLFHPRRWHISSNFNPDSERFALNSEQLRSLGIPTPETIGLYRLQDGSSAVHYRSPPGQTLHQAFTFCVTSQERQALTRGFGKFLARLHEQGVYLRSLHSGNVLVLENGEFGLIDLADLRIFPSALSLSRRRRNLQHLQRAPQDRAWLFTEQFEALLQGYAAIASVSAVNYLQQQVTPRPSGLVQPR